MTNKKIKLWIELKRWVLNNDYSYQNLLILLYRVNDLKGLADKEKKKVLKGKMKK